MTTHSGRNANRESCILFAIVLSLIFLMPNATNAKIKFQTPGPDITITGFELVNPENGQVIATLGSELNLNYNDYPDFLPTIRAITSPSNVGSVEFTLKHRTTTVVFHQHVDNEADYYLFGNDQNSIYTGLLGVRPLTLIATPYSSAEGRGDAGTPLSIQIAASFSFDDLKTELSLIDADNDQDLGPIPANGKKYVESLNSKSLSIQLNVNHAGLYEARFDIRALDGSPVFDGSPMYNSADQFSPYYLFGDENGDYEGMIFTEGEYQLIYEVRGKSEYVVDTTQEAGRRIGLFTCSFYLKNDEGMVVQDIVLVNAETGQDIMGIEEGMVISIADLPNPNDSLSIKANFSSEQIGSVRFELSGPDKYFKTENHAPWLLFGNKDDNVIGGVITPSLNYPDEIPYQLKVTPYSEDYLAGEAGETLVRNFTLLLNLDEIDYYLVNTDTDEDIVAINDNPTVNLDAIGNPPLSVRADISSIYLQSMRYNLTGPDIDHVQMENEEPYVLFGNDEITNDLVGRQLAPGTYNIETLLYSENYWGGILLKKPDEFSFTLVNNGSAKPLTANHKLSIYPVPSQRDINISYIRSQQENQVQLVVVNSNNQVIFEKTYTEDVQAKLDLSAHKNQFLYVKLITDQKVINKKIIMN